PLRPFYVTLIVRWVGSAERTHLERHSAGRRRGCLLGPIRYLHGRFLGPNFYNGMRRRDSVTFSRRGSTMSTEQAQPFLVDAVRASASKVQGMKAALAARAKERDALTVQLEAGRQPPEQRAPRPERARRPSAGGRAA